MKINCLKIIAKIRMFRPSTVIGVLALMPILYGIYHGTVIYEKSKKTTQVLTYWLPAKYAVVRDMPEQTKSMGNILVDSFDTFTNAFSGQKIYVQPHENGVHYFTTVGNVMFYNHVRAYAGYSDAGMSTMTYQFDKDGQVTVSGKRSWMLIIMQSLVHCVFTTLVVYIMIFFISVVIFSVFNTSWDELRDENISWCKKSETRR